jgi:hypothetical protein
MSQPIITQPQPIPVQQEPPNAPGPDPDTYNPKIRNPTLPNPAVSTNFSGDAQISILTKQNSVKISLSSQEFFSKILLASLHSETALKLLITIVESSKSQLLTLVEFERLSNSKPYPEPAKEILFDLLMDFITTLMNKSDDHTKSLSSLLSALQNFDPTLTPEDSKKTFLILEASLFALAEKMTSKGFFTTNGPLLRRFFADGYTGLESNGPTFLKLGFLLNCSANPKFLEFGLARKLDIFAILLQNESQVYELTRDLQ